jgi:hypothetical protein
MEILQEYLILANPHPLSAGTGRIKSPAGEPGGKFSGGGVIPLSQNLCKKAPSRKFSATKRWLIEVSQSIFSGGGVICKSHKLCQESPPPENILVLNLVLQTALQ